MPSQVSTYTKDGSSSAVEFGTTSITSANWNEGRDDQEVISAEQLVQSKNPHLKFVNARDHGYLILSIDQNQVKSDWYYVDDVKQPNAKENLAKSIVVKQGTNKITL